MGADLLLYAVPLVPEPDWIAGAVQIVEVTRVGTDGTAVHGDALDNAGLDPDDTAEAQRLLTDDLAELRRVVEGGQRRDVTTLTLRGHDYLFTGGMSSGDTPTDFADVVNRLAWTGVLDACGFTEADSNAVTLRL